MKKKLKISAKDVADLKRKRIGFRGGDEGTVN
jgi:hypothetical protein